jgi:protein O-mannosyl-transferase
VDMAYTDLKPRQRLTTEIDKKRAPVPSLPPTTRPILFVLPLIAAAAGFLVIVLPALDGPLVLDSLKLHGLERIVREHGNLAIFHTPAFGGGYHRIVAMATFVANIQALGELSAFQVKLTNAGIHLLAAALVFLLTRAILRPAAHARLAAGIALGTSVLWLLSPLNFNVAMYGVQRMAQLSALFTFAGLALYTIGRLHDQPARRRLYIALAALVCLPVAVLSKQNGVLLVPLAFLVEVYFLHSVRPWWTTRQLTLAAVIGAAAALALLFYLYPGILSYHARDFTLAERLLSQPRALIGYLQHLLLPFGGDIGVYTDDFAASKSLLAPVSSTASLLAVAAIAVFCVVCHRGRFRLVAFGLAFFLVGHALESTFLPLELYFLHRNYLPGYGVYFALVALLFVLPIRRQWLIVALTLYAAYFAAISYARSMTWSSSERIVSAAVHYHPNSPRALSNFAQLAVELGRFDLAETAVKRVIELQGTLNARVQILYIRCRADAPISPGDYGKLAEIRTFGIAIEFSQALSNLLTLYERGGCDQLRTGALVEALDELAGEYHRQGRNPWTLAYYADAFLYASGDREAAHQRLQRRFENGRIEAGMYRLELLIQEGDRETARSVLNRIDEKLAGGARNRFEDILDDFRRQVEGMR